MKILYIVNGYPTVERPYFLSFVKDQIDSVKSSGQDVEILNISGRGFLKYVKAVFKIRRMWRDYDIVHAQHMLCGLAAILSGARSRLITSFMSDGAANLRGKSRFIGLLLFHITSFLSSACIYKVPVPRLYKKKSIYLPNGVDVEHFQPLDKTECRKKLGLSLSKKYALFVSSGGVDGPLRAVKRYDLYQKMLSDLSESDSSWSELLMCNVNRVDAPLYFNAADILILTSDAEGSPNAVKEALSCGLPVIARNVGDVSLLLDGVPSCMCFCLDLWEEAVSFAASTSDVTPDAIRNAFLKKGLDRMSIREKLLGFYYRIRGSSA